MKKEVGLWIDHRKTVIVTVENDVEIIREINSNVEKRVRFSSGGRAKDSSQPQGANAEDVRDRAFEDHLETYYEGIISLVQSANSILIMGPGEAKGELVKLLKRHGLGDHIVGVETVDKLTDRQIIARTRQHFQNY